MCKFSLYVFKIIIVSLSIAFLIQSLADSGLKKIENSIYDDWNKILDGSINSELVILGSSRGCVSYDPRIIQQTTGFSSFNLSMNAGSYNLQELKFKSYIINNKYPKIIIQNIDLTHFSESNVLPEEYQFLPYLNNKNLSRSLKDFNSDYSWYQYLPLLKYNSYKSFLVKGLLSSFGKTYSISKTIQGYTPKNPLFKIDKHNLKSLKELRSDSSNIQLFRNKLLILNGFLNKYKTDSVVVFLVWAPEYQKRLDIIKSTITPLKKDIARISYEMSGVYFLDFSEDPINLKKEYFYDTFHLNEKGATLFSTKLSIEIDKILKN